MNTPIEIPVDKIIHTFEHPYCGQASCICNTPLRDANDEAVARIRSIERAMSLQEARETLRIKMQDLGDHYTATYDSETASLQLVRADSGIRLILTLEVCYHLSDFLVAMLPMRTELDSYLQWKLSALLSLSKGETAEGQKEASPHDSR